MTPYRDEKPILLIDHPDAPLCRMAMDLAEWVEDDERRREGGAGSVVGVYGGRGTGKTSFLWTLFEILRKKNEKLKSSGQPPRCVLRQVDYKEAPLVPSDTRRNDNLLFLLLEHLRGYSTQGNHVSERFF